MPKNKKKLKLRSTIIFSKQVAKRFSKIAYYKAQASNMRNFEFIEREKARLSTPAWEKVTSLIEHYKTLGETTSSSAGRTLQGIYLKNKAAAMSGTVAKNTNLISVVGNPELLALAYRSIRKNKGAMTSGAYISKEKFDRMTDEQKEAYHKGFKLPDGMSPYWLELIARLIRKGKYPWGSSSRTYIDKPGQPGKKRPITVPPFADRLVQKAIELVLQSIYEPFFERRNRSFGFRPNKGVHDAIAALLSYQNNGARSAIEGDVEAAYDTVDKERLLEVLQKRITDRKFINFLRERLNYDFVEKETGNRIRPLDGIPQGGIDSPYLFNIYMAEFDDFVHTEVQSYVDGLNSRVKTRTVSRAFTSNRAERKKFLRQLAKAKVELRALPRDKSLPMVQRQIRIIRNLIKQIRLNNHRKNRLSSSSNTDRILRIYYVRYADDWILLTNGSLEFCKKIKEMISEFLQNRLKLKLSDSKTLITDITKEPARFLGFEVRNSARGALRKLKVEGDGLRSNTVSKKSGLLIWLAPDRQRLISRFHMKGYCTEKGYPITVPWLSALEPQVIVDRFNAVIRGLAEFYLPQIRNKSTLHRWVYILRFSCIKTLAQKYKSTIGKMFKRFGYNMHSKSAQTIRIRVQLKVRNKEYFKDWKLLTYQDLKEMIPHEQRKLSLGKSYWRIEKGSIGGYAAKEGRVPKVTNDDFVDRISWVSWRTQAGLNLPCAHCGTLDNVQQHHIRHVRKRGYVFVPEEEAYQRILQLRNRKQIPLCFDCHRKVVHTGKYQGPSLGALAPVKTIDNRIVHVESFVKPGVVYNSKRLEEKGWIPLDQ